VGDYEIRAVKVFLQTVGIAAGFRRQKRHSTLVDRQLVCIFSNLEARLTCFVYAWSSGFSLTEEWRYYYKMTMTTYLITRHISNDVNTKRQALTAKLRLALSDKSALIS